jgi:preprotein translocase subunit SecE
MGHSFYPMGARSNWLFYAVSIFLIAAQFYLNISVRMKILVILLASSLVLYAVSRTELGQRFLAYLGDTRKEIRKIVWPTQQETMKSVLMVALFVMSAAVFWWIVDAMIAKFFALILKIVS